jgi:tetratricopeptide (TPR) repeat protein
MTDTGRTSELLARLGLAPGTGLAKVEAAHTELVAYLNAAPRMARPWARRQLGEIEFAYASLVREVGRGASSRSAAAANSRYVASDADDAEELLDALDGGAPASARQRVTVTHRRQPAAHPNRLSGTAIGAQQQGGLRRLALGAGALVVAAVAIFAVYKLGEPSVPGITGSPAPSSLAGGVDQAEVLTLMSKLSDNPQDLATLQDLANLYYAAGDYAAAGTWLDKILAIDPKNVAALLGSGAASFNLGDNASAEADWRAVLAVDPKNAEAHYDLGFMYLSKDPPDMDKVRAEWNEVIAIDPNSDIAKTVATHLDSFGAAASPAVSPGATTSSSSGAPSASPATPAPSPAASPS